GGGGRKILPVMLNRLVSTTLTPGPPTFGPWLRKTLVANGLPMIAWGVAGVPMNPAGGSDAAGSHCKNGPTLGWATANVKSQAGGTAAHPRLSVKLIPPSAVATKLLVPNGAVRT